MWKTNEAYVSAEVILLRKGNEGSACREKICLAIIVLRGSECMKRWIGLEAVILRDPYDIL